MKKVILFLLFGYLLQSCSISFTTSTLRVPEKQMLNLSPDVQLSLTGAVYMNFFGFMKSDFIPASTQIIAKDKVIYIDPVIVSDPQKADYIFITHAHADHFWKPEIEKLSTSKTLIIAPKSVTKKISEYKTCTTHLGEVAQLADLTYEVIPAYNLKHKKLQMTIHKNTDDFAGYVLSIDSVRIYHAGDTDFIPELKDLKKITVALLPIGIGKTAMNPVDAAEATNTIHPKIVVPIHYEPNKNQELEFSNLVDQSIQVKY